MNVPILKRWSIGWIREDPYMAPEMNRTCVYGNIYGSERFNDGELIKTNAIVESKGRIITTESGSQYRLYGRPFKAYVNWMKENGIEYDGKNPVRMR